MAYRLGIDVGTSSTVAILVGPDGHSRLVLPHGRMPSAVYWGDGGFRVGEPAVAMQAAQPGQCEPTPKKRVSEDLLLLGDEVPIADVFAAILSYVRAEAERLAGEQIADVTLTHPEGWGSERRGVLLRAAQQAGMSAPTLVSEPLAAYFARTISDKPGAITVVYDLGAGTCDICVLEATLDDGVGVRASAGLEIGGLDIDEALLKMLAQDGQYTSRMRSLLAPTTEEERREALALRQAVSRAKEALSSTAYTEVYMGGGAKAYVTRDELEAAAKPLLAQTVQLLLKTLVTARLTPAKVHRVLLVGGASRMPLVATMLRQAGFTVESIGQPELDVATGCLWVPTKLLARSPEPLPAPEPAPPLRLAVAEPPAADKTPPPAKRRRTSRWLTAAIAIAVLAGAGVVWYQQDSKPPDVDCAATDFCGSKGIIRAIDAVGSRVAVTSEAGGVYVWNAADHKLLWQTTFDNADAIALTDKYAIVSGSHVAVFDVTTGAAVKTLSDSPGTSVHVCSNLIAWKDSKERRIHTATIDAWGTNTIPESTDEFTCSSNLALASYSDSRPIGKLTASVGMLKSIDLATGNLKASIDVAHGAYGIDGDALVFVAPAIGNYVLRVTDNKFGAVQESTWTYPTTRATDVNGGMIAVAYDNALQVRPVRPAAGVDGRSFTVDAGDVVTALKLNQGAHQLFAAMNTSDDVQAALSANPTGSATLRLLQL